ncbi:hypothetical protein BASA81_006397 [Batrachochytrium salamandrivorans]|nr:hypothetical protein BASA81_006397 [Batrachochytrium salamandrivorans]
MGITRSKEFSAAQARSKKLDRVVQNYHAMDSKVIKLLLLGAGESGKSTIFKQMKYIYGNPYPLKERQQLLSTVHSNILGNLRLLVKACDRFTALENQAELIPALASIPDSEDDALIDSKVGALLKQVWLDPGAQATWKRRSEFQIQEALEWYMADIDRISAIDYVPTVDDIFRARVRTSGIVEETFHIDQVEFLMYDVGGQRNERKKWSHLLSQSAALLYVVAINEYDQYLYEDENMHRMDEALMLFEETINLKHFLNTSVILFLNKSDLFRDKLKTVPVRVVGQRFEDFRGPYYVEGGNADLQKCYDAAVDYFLQLFLQRNHRPEREIYHHVTCATDTNNVKVVFTACKHIILSNHLAASGFMA